MKHEEFKPYHIRAMHEYLTDNNKVPHMAVAADYPGVAVPREYVNEQGIIVLNIAYGACDTLEMNNHTITFNARFSGTPMLIIVPVEAVLSLYDRDTGHGAAWMVNVPATDLEINKEALKVKEEGEKKSTAKGSHLRVVK